MTCKQRAYSEKWHTYFFAESNNGDPSLENLFGVCPGDSGGKFDGSKTC